MLKTRLFSFHECFGFTSRNEIAPTKKKKDKPNWLTLKIFILNMKQHYI